MKILVVLAFAFVLQNIVHGKTFGLTVSMGFDTLEQCEKRLAEIMTSVEGEEKPSDDNVTFRGACMPQEQLQQYLGSQHTDT